MEIFRVNSCSSLKTEEIFGKFGASQSRQRYVPDRTARAVISRTIGCLVLELQRMFEHSNIIRLRFSRTNFFYERTFVDARWSVFGAHIAERSFGRGLARGSHARTNGATLEILRRRLSMSCPGDQQRKKR